ncbi:MAG: hypothetical protein LBQ16_03760, partial [Gracilibacteraceae bacterium]|nr:hypothetical protein [Gracilibacteraceae bacterium]
DNNLCIFASKLDGQEPLQSHIEYILSFIKENASNIKELQPECEFDIICAYSSLNGQGGFTENRVERRRQRREPLSLSFSNLSVMLT